MLPPSSGLETQSNDGYRVLEVQAIKNLLSKVMSFGFLVVELYLLSLLKPILHAGECIGSRPSRITKGMIPCYTLGKRLDRPQDFPGSSNIQKKLCHYGD
jgi:hypothetical protein